MYGFLILIFKKIVENEFGEEAWECLLEQSGLRLRIFQTRRKYWDETLLQLFKVYAQELDIKLEQVAYENGLFFHEFVECAGYGNLLKIQGRNFLGFLEQIDNLHEYLKFSYPRIRSPSFLVLDSSETHITLLYESTRCGYTPYVQGQLTAIARQIYATEISVDCKPSVQVGAVYKTILEIRCLKGGWSEKSTFPNQEVALMEQAGFSSLGSDFLSLFAFHLLITEDMTIQHVGRSMCLLDSNLVGADFRSKFTFIRPFIEPSFEKIQTYKSNIFQIEYIGQENGSGAIENRPTRMFEGQMLYISEWEAMIFLCTIRVADAASLRQLGYFLSDMNMHDHSREIVMLGNQKSEELVMLLEQQKASCASTQKAAQNIVKTRRATNELLNQCIPRSIARSLKKGMSPMETIQKFDCVSVCFTKVEDFIKLCGKVNLCDIVKLLNQMYSIFDTISERFKVYKVETIGDSYMIASGLPSMTRYHSAHIAETILAILEQTTQKLFWPVLKEESEKRPVRLYVGCHTGPVVAGVVGLHSPRYCLFGNTVNVASRMMSHGVPNRIHVSREFYTEVSKYPYKLTLRGSITVKGKGELLTYFLDGHQATSGASYNHWEGGLSFGGMLIADRDRVSDDEEEKESTESTFSDNQKPTEANDTDAQLTDEFTDAIDEEERLYRRDMEPSLRDRRLSNTSHRKQWMKGIPPKCGGATGSSQELANKSDIMSEIGDEATDISSASSVSMCATAAQPAHALLKSSFDQTAPPPTSCPFGMMLESKPELNGQAAGKETLLFFEKVAKKLLDEQAQTQSNGSYRKSVHFAGGGANLPAACIDQSSNSTPMVNSPESVSANDNRETASASPAAQFQTKQVVVDEVDRKWMRQTENSAKGMRVRKNELLKEEEDPEHGGGKGAEEEEEEEEKEARKQPQVRQQPVPANEPAKEGSIPIVAFTTAINHKRACGDTIKVMSEVAKGKSEIESKKLLALPLRKKALKRSDIDASGKKLDTQSETPQKKVLMSRKVTKLEKRSDQYVQDDPAERQQEKPEDGIQMLKPKAHGCTAILATARAALQQWKVPIDEASKSILTAPPFRQLKTFLRTRLLRLPLGDQGTQSDISPCVYEFMQYCNQLSRCLIPRLPPEAFHSIRDAENDQ